MMNSNDIDKSYVSPYDKFLFEFDATHSKSESQIREIAKHARIAMMRDNPEHQERQSEIWTDF